MKEFLKVNNVYGSKDGNSENKKQLARVLKTVWPAVFESFFILLAGMLCVRMGDLRNLDGNKNIGGEI